MAFTPVAKKVLGMVFIRELKHQIRVGSMSAVRGYVSTVGKIRLLAIACFAMAAVAGLLVSGTMMMIGGAIWWIAQGTEWPQVTLTLTGALLAIASGTLVVLAFSERRWLDLSGAYKLIDMVLADQVSTTAAVDAAAAAVAKKAADLMVQPLAAAERKGKRFVERVSNQPPGDIIHA